MPAEEAITLCKKDLVEEMERMLENCYQLDAGKLLRDRALLCKGGSVYAARRSLIEELWKTHPYTAGVHIAVARGRVLQPSLGLLSLLSREDMQPGTHYAMITWRGAVFFLYGRDVLPGSIVRVSIKQGCRLPLIVLDPDGLPLGYGRPRRRNGELIILNVLDAGWYLRSGV